MKTKEEILQMFKDKQNELIKGTTPQKALMLNIEIILLREIIGDDIPEKCRE